MSDFKQNFGARLKELRRSKNYNQETFAELIGITPRNLSKIETGKTFPSCDNLEKIISKLECLPGVLFNFTTPSDTEDMRLYIKNGIKVLDDEKIFILYKVLKSIE